MLSTSTKTNEPMADPNSWIHNICRFLTYCRRTMASGIESSQHFGERVLQLELPERVMGLIHCNREMPQKCRLFLGFVNILTVAIVVGLAMEGTSPDGPQLQQREDDHDQADWNSKKEQDRNSQHGIFKVKVEDSKLPRIKEEVEKPEASKAHERAECTSTVSEQCSAVCNCCTASSKKTHRLLTEFGYAEGEEHIVSFTGCTVSGGVQDTNEANQGDRVDLESVHPAVHTPRGDLEGAAQGESIGCSRDVQGEDQRHSIQAQEKQYWRNRVLDILAPSLHPLPDLFLPDLFNDFGNMNQSGHNTSGTVVEADQSHHVCAGSEEDNAHSLQPLPDLFLPDLFNDFGNVNESGHNAGGNVVEGDQSHYECAGSQEENAHERSRRFHDVENNEAVTDAVNSLETILENEENCNAIQRARVGTHGMDQFFDESLTEQQNSPQIVVEIQLPASVLSSQPSDYNSEYPRSSTAIPTRPATPPQVDRHDYYSTSAMDHSRSLIVIYNPTSAPTEISQPELSNAPQSEYYDAQPDFSNAPRPEYYVNNGDPSFIDAFSHGGNTSSGPPHYSSSDDDEIRSQPSSSLSSRSFRSWSAPVPSGRHHLHTSSFASSERPRWRASARRPRCGLRMMKALRDDPACTPEEGKKRRQPGREDKLFKPKRGDVICRHTVVPGRGVVEIYLPGIEERLQEGDSLVRLKMDNTSYPTMLIVSAKAYLFLQGRWMYVGRHQHGVRKPKKERLPL